MSLPLPPLLRRSLGALALAISTLALAVGTAAAAVLDLEQLDGRTAVAMMEKGELTSVELTQAYLDRIEALNQAGPGLNAVSQLNKQALKEAQRYDQLRAEGTVLSPAMGLPILLKDLIDVKGMYTSAGNYSLRDSYPETDSGLAQKLRENGVVILGKLGLSEYANSFGRQPSGFGNLTGQVLNGLDTDQTPSGSSSGTGTAGAAALSTLTVGTETSGSITSPSRTQGLVGLRPTVGLVPGRGIAPIRASQDTAGPMDRTVADAALTLTAISGPDPVDAAYYERYYAEGGLDVNDVVPPLPLPMPNYLAALDPDFVEGKRIGYFGDAPEILEAVAALEAAGAIVEERPLIPTDPMPSLAGAGEQHMAIDLYYERLGAGAPINSLAEEIADNTLNSHEALKFGNNSHASAFATPWGLGTPWEAEFKANLPIRKQKAWEGIERMLANNTPDPSDDYLAILGASNTGPAPNGPLAGYPAITMPMGYSETQRRAIGVSISGGAYSEFDLLGIAYALEQQTQKRKPASLVNPSMYRCADTVPAPPFADRGDCNPDYDTALAAAGGTVPELEFSLETTSAAELQEMMETGELTAADLTKAYLARIAVSNAAGPAVQAVRALNPDAVAEAEALDAERFGTTGSRGPLHGIPVLVNDGIDAAGLPSTGGSIALQGALPDEDSAIVAKLKEAGAIVLGTANVTELGAMVSDDMTDGYSSLGGQVLLPSDTDDPPAGSSAGAAAAVSSGMAAMAVGLETSAASAELIGPAGANGVVGLKPTVGRVSRTGVMPVARSQDAPGPIAQTVADAAAQLQAIAGTDADDPATVGTPAAPDYLDALDEEALDGAAIAVIANGSESENTKPVYDAALNTVATLGATTTVVAVPSPALPDITVKEFGRDLDDYLGGLSGGNAASLEEIVDYNQANPVEGLKFQQGGLLAAAAVDLGDPAELAAYEEDLEASQDGAAAVLDAILASKDLIMVPSESSLVDLADKAGYPVLSVLGGYGVEQMGRNPVGVAFIAAPFEEAELLAAGHAYEAASVERLAPSWTNPSMYRCVELSEFYSPHHCRPGTVEPLVTVPPQPAPPVAAAPPAAGTPRIAIRVAPKLRAVGPARKQVSYRITVANVGNAPSGRIRLCASAPKARVRVLGKRCVGFGLAGSGARVRTVALRVKPAAAGKLTRIVFTARGPQVGTKKAGARLKVKAAR